MGVMNMILHGIESPNISKSNTLTKILEDLKRKIDLIVFWQILLFGKEKEQIQTISQ